MTDRDKAIRGLECCMVGDGHSPKCEICPYATVGDDTCQTMDALFSDALALLKAQEQRHRLEVHNIGNVDMPECVSEEQFYAVMNNVVAALEHTDKGESWPYDEEGR